MNKKNLSQKELEDIVENLTDFSSGSSDVYKPSTSESHSSDDYEKKNNTDTMKRKKITKDPKMMKVLKTKNQVVKMIRTMMIQILR